MAKHKHSVMILDFGSQYTQLIARRIRECSVYSEITRHDVPAAEILRNKPKAMVLSGGPASVTADSSPLCDAKIFNLGIPVLGICYGMQLTGKLLHGDVQSSPRREYGHANLAIDKPDDLFFGIKRNTSVWMSHGDKVTKLPPGFETLAHTANSAIASMRNRTKRIYGVQFHPEVIHTNMGTEILKNFLFRIAGCRPDWTMKSFIKNAVEEIRGRVKNEKVLCAMSGGVDSSVLSVLLNKALGDDAVSVFVNNGVLRKNEPEQVIETFKKNFHVNLKYVDDSRLFLNKLKDVEDPELKRKIIGKQFIRTFERTANSLGDIKFLAQGTLYPDVIESKSAKGAPSATIKTHHNVGGLPKRMKFKLIEPFKELFKDEVRKIGTELGLPEEIVWRHPFPGPGLAVRIIGSITEERIAVLRDADEIFINELKSSGQYRKIWQAFAVLLPVKSVGVMGDERTYENVVALRAVTSLDGMTADWAKIPQKLLGRISNRIINEVKGINRVVYDVSSKPPSTIEWE